MAILGAPRQDAMFGHLTRAVLDDKLVISNTRRERECHESTPVTRLSSKYMPMRCRDEMRARRHELYGQP